MTVESTVFFGPWRFTQSDGKLISDTEQHRLPPRLNLLLSLLLESAGQVVARDDIIDAMWGDKVVNDDALARAIAELRNLLGDSSKSPVFIETIPRRGYRFICVVHSGTPLTDELAKPEKSQESEKPDESGESEVTSPEMPSNSTTEQRQQRWLGKRLLIIGVLMAVLVLTSSTLVVTGVWSPQEGLLGFKSASSQVGRDADKQKNTETATTEPLTAKQASSSQNLMSQLVNAKRLTSDAEIEVHPELSFDGDFLTFSTLKPSSNPSSKPSSKPQQPPFYSVTIKDTRTGQSTVVKKAQTHLVSATLSPDNKRMLALAIKPSSINGESACTVMVFDVATQVSQALTECSLPDRSAVLDWHPNGNRFLFVKQVTNSEHFVIVEFDLDTQTETILTDLSEASDPLLYDSRPRYAPNGESFAFLRGTPSVRNVFVQRFNSTISKTTYSALSEETPVVRQVTNTNSVKVSFDWMPSGQAVLFDSNILGDKQIFLAEVVTEPSKDEVAKPQASAMITNVGGKDGQFPMINHNGTVVAYQEARYQANLWKMNVDSQTPSATQVVQSLKYDNFPAFNPIDPTSLLYVSNRSGFAAIYQLDMNTQASQELLRVPDTHLIAPVFSSDGNRVLISAITSRDFYCYEFELQSRSLAKLPAQDISLCSYGANPKSTASSDTIWAIDKSADGGLALVEVSRIDDTKRKIMRGPIDNFVFANSTQEIVFTKRQQPGLFAIGVDAVSMDETGADTKGGDVQTTSRTLIADLPTRFSHSWSIAGDHLYYVNAKQNKQIWRKDLRRRGSDLQVTKSLDYAIGRVLSVSPDEQSLVVSLKGNESGNIFIYDGRQ